MTSFRGSVGHGALGVRVTVVAQPLVAAIDGGLAFVRLVPVRATGGLRRRSEEQVAVVLVRPRGDAPRSLVAVRLALLERRLAL